VASVLERKLNKIGVYKYQQIMQWDDIAVEEFSKLLAFRDRIQRDNWIGQARRLYRQHYERRAA
jgi:predicted flap endonuclease-1-like 5' DNA nuclease